MVTTTSGYEATKLLAAEHPEWISALMGCLICSERSGRFAGSWVFQKDAPRPQNLRPLVRYGILQREGTSRSGHRAYYTMIDPEGVRRALTEMGITAEGW
jgi:hypothetical protein